MQFFDLRYEDGLTDTQQARRNPITAAAEFWLPGVHCTACGNTWAGSDRLRIKIPDAARPLLSGAAGPPIETIGRWRETIKPIADALELPPDRLTPGMQIGLPKGTVTARTLPDIVHLCMGQIWVSEAVIQTLSSAGLGGFVPVSADLGWATRIKTSAPPPPRFEVVVTGKAWRKGFRLEDEIDCHECGRRTFPDGTYLEVDESRWDGGDFVNLDRNPNIVIVTSRVRDALTAGGFTNWECVPV